LDVPVDLPLSQVEFFLVCARSMRHVPRIAAVAAELLPVFRKIPGVRVVDER